MKPDGTKHKDTNGELSTLIEPCLVTKSILSYLHRLNTALGDCHRHKIII